MSAVKSMFPIHYSADHVMFEAHVGSSIERNDLIRFVVASSRTGSLRPRYFVVPVLKSPSNRAKIDIVGSIRIVVSKVKPFRQGRGSMSGHLGPSSL